MPSGLTLKETAAVNILTPATNKATVFLDSVTGALAYKDDAGVSLPVGSTFTGGTLTSALNEAPIVTIASSGTVAIGAAAGNTISISGTTTITAFDTIASGALRQLVFQGILTLTHNATSLIVPTGASIVTAAGDTAVMLSLGSGNWRCIDYQRASGVALAGAGGSTTQVQYNSSGALAGDARFIFDATNKVAKGQFTVDTSGVNAQTGTTYTLNATDNGGVVTLSNGSAITVTVPSGLGKGYSVICIQIGAGQVTFTASGVTLNSASALVKINGQHAAATLIAYVADVFNLSGNLSA